VRFNLICFLLLIFVSCNPSEDVIGDCYVSPEPDTVCIEIYEPVCACNNLVYGNSCKAKKAGNLSWKSTSLASGEECKY
jgi:hypothetical protein|tara:strand:+ start:243 stop:479 length:237 start_codon:yes stop_codon:yes gene_type:complete